MHMTFEITEMQDMLVISIKGEPRVGDIKQIADTPAGCQPAVKPHHDNMQTCAPDDNS